jgi:DNA excision repair protein ERCC-2
MVKTVRIDDLDVIFPYADIYPEQYKYMVELKRGLDERGHLLLEMPSGTGKTITLLALIVAYKERWPDRIAKLVYCTRTVPEMEKVLEELRRLMQYRKHVRHTDMSLLGVGLSSRKNLCCHPTVSAKPSGQEVDSACKALTGSWLRDIEDAAEGVSARGCDFYNAWDRDRDTTEIPQGVYTLREMKEWASKKHWCPYFVARHALEVADVIVYNYAYLLDPKIANVVSEKLPRNCVVVFDEAHNIDSVCTEVLSVTLTEAVVKGAEANINALQSNVQRAYRERAERVEIEYTRLVTGLALAGMPTVDLVQGVPISAEDMVNEPVPGNMRRPEHFLKLLGRLIHWLRTGVFTLRIPQVLKSSLFLQKIKQETGTDYQHLKFCSERLHVLFNELGISEVYQYRHLLLVADFATLLATYSFNPRHPDRDGYQVIFEPYDERNPQLVDPVLQLACMDASRAIGHLLEKYQCVVFTSGTLTPLTIYPKLLDFHPLAAVSFEIELQRRSISPLIVTRGADQVALSTRFGVRSDASVVRNYGQLLLELAAVVPDGLLCFFTSYAYMEEVVAEWHKMDILTKLTRHKLLFFETQNVAETAQSVANFRHACDVGRGAIFMSISRGKVAEGIDFDGHYGRAVVMVGIPFVNVESRVLKERFQWLETHLKIKTEEYLSFDALRHASQCLGRVLRNKQDYGLMILADRRYSRLDRREKLPKWIRDHITDQAANLSTDVAVAKARLFFAEMAQPLTRRERMGFPPEGPSAKRPRGETAVTKRSPIGLMGDAATHAPAPSSPLPSLASPTLSSFPPSPSFAPSPDPGPPPIDTPHPADGIPGVSS